LPRTEVHHELDGTTCACGYQIGRIRENVAEKLDYTPGIFSVERHIRGKLVCQACETLVQAPVPVHAIDKGLPTAGLLTQVLVAKHQGHLPLYRQEAMEKAPRPHQPPEREGLRTDPEYTGQMSNSQAGKLGYSS
jgi:transposase